MTSAEWAALNPTLNPQVVGIESDTGKIKIGDGRNSWTKLGYAAGSASTEPFETLRVESPNGTVFAITVADDGQLSATEE